MSEHPDPLDWLATEQREPGVRTDFAAALVHTDDELVAVGSVLADAVTPVTTAFLDADAHAAEQAATTEAAVTRRCHTLEEACYVLIARQSPVAGDLRHLIAVLRSVTDVQRSASLLRHISNTLHWVHPPAMPDDVRQLIGQLGSTATDILRGGLAAWASHDGLAANELDRADDQVDFLQKCLLTEVYTSGRPVEEAVSLALLGRYYERIADHGVELARNVAYFLTGERLVTGQPPR